MANTIGIAGSVGNTYSDPGVYYDKRFLSRLTPQLYFKQCGEMRPLPAKSGTLVKWHRLNKMAVATTALTENVNPAASTAGTAVVTAEPLTYGDWMKISTELNLKSINPIVEEIQDEQADQAALTYDTIVRNAIHNNLTNQFAGGAGNEVSVADTSILNPSEIRKAVYSLRKASVPGFDGNLYKGLIHPASQFDLLSDSAAGSWLDVHKYTKSEPMMKGEIGQLYGVRFVVSPNVDATGTGATDEVVRNFIFGKGAFGITEMAAHGIKTHRFSQGSTENPLARYSTIGWTMMLAAKALDATRGVQLYCGTAAD